ncbi:MAG: RES family NAD+ phosphorylase [Halieaceae bacterium]|nr:RES family NAD+ phosphorylase [Halieaceae bacterium]
MTAHRFPVTVFSAFAGEVIRIVESQEQVATTRIVGNLVEQDLLEHMLEDSKPGSIDSGLHYLLSTPFRYPPLRHGSRFGSTLEPSLFYGSLELRTCLQECAYYRFIFWYDMATPPPNPITTQHTVFRVALESERCVDLQAGAYFKIQPQLQSPVSYATSQALGSHLRQAGAQLLVFASARGPGSNAAAYTPGVFASAPGGQELWHSGLSSELVLLRGAGGLFRFPLSQFAGDDGHLLRVAA